VWVLVGGKSDPFVVVLQREGTVLRELGRSEVICNNLNPTFVKSIPMVSMRVGMVDSLQDARWY
jgi:hypothetical protein